MIFAGFERFDIDALLFAPGEVAQVEDAFAVALRQFDDVFGARTFRVFAERFGGVEHIEFAVEIAVDDEFFFGAIHAGAVGGDGHDDVVFAEFHILRCLDGREDVGDRREAEVFEAVDEFFFDAAARGEVFATGFGVIEGEGVVGGFVGERQDEVGVHDVVNEWDVFVADALDVVIAEAVVAERRAFEGFDGDGLGSVCFFEEVASADGACRTRRRDEGTQFRVLVRLFEVFEDGRKGFAGAEIVREVVVELGKLIEDEVGGIFGEFVTFVVDFFDVGFATVCGDDVFFGVHRPFAEPLESFLAHAFGQDGDATAIHEAADGDATAAIVARRGPNGAVFRRVESAQDDARSEACVGGEDFVRADHGSEAADQCDDRRIDTGDFFRQNEVNGDFDEVFAVFAVIPVNAIEVEGIGGIGIDVFEGFFDIGRNLCRIGEHVERRERNFALFKSFDGIVECRFVDNFCRQTKSFENFFHESTS